MNLLFQRRHLFLVVLFIVSLSIKLLMIAVFISPEYIQYENRFKENTGRIFDDVEYYLTAKGIINEHVFSSQMAGD